MSEPLGLSGWRWNNNLKSMLLLAAFPFLLLALLWIFYLAAGYAVANPNQEVDAVNAAAIGITTNTALRPVDLAMEAIYAYGHYALIAAAIWMAFGFMFHSWMVEKATGAKPVTRAENPRIYNLLENLCISRGLAVPKIAIIETDQLNAFASGLSDKSYTVTVTRGLLNTLDDDELEGVLAHELSHIMNRDVRLLIFTVVFVGMISFLAEMLWRGIRHASFSSNRGGKKGGGAALLLLIGAIVMAVGYLFALVLRFAISRKREYLADAGAVALTKKPEALVSALQKISGHAKMPGVPAEVKQMFIENPPEFGFFSLFATHPPIEKRIDVLRRIGGLPEPAKSLLPNS